MINRQNWLDVKEYLAYMGEVKLVDEKTVKRAWSWLRHLLEWANEKPLPRAREITPAFPVYLMTASKKNVGESLAPITMRKACEYSRSFFEHMMREHPGRYRVISTAWVDTIRPPRARGIQSEIKDHKYYNLDEMTRIAHVSVASLAQERDRAAMCFLYLSGMRADAFVSLPIHCVDMGTGRVWQVPDEGVRTKNHKAAITSLLIIPVLFDVVKAWDAKVRSALPDDAMWYSSVSQDNEQFVYKNTSAAGRRTILARGMRRICVSAGVEYKSPHKLRHGHAVYGIKAVKDLKGLKAVSQNLMHSSVSITDGLYGNLVEDDVHELIHSLGDGDGDKGKVSLQEMDKLEKLITLLNTPGISEFLRKS
jgi:site-specific recombinase XerC